MTVHGDVINYLLLRYLDRSMTVHGDVINYFCFVILTDPGVTVVTLPVAMT